ncbi:hypothetical protein N0V88_006132 [Collariella sp. IMI 366227]|nr:hypothetical protein N0V88_006132 [Collariella sp. IMI 366227]
MPEKSSKMTAADAARIGRSRGSADAFAQRAAAAAARNSGGQQQSGGGGEKKDGGRVGRSENLHT